MANPDGYPREVHVKLDNGTGTITYRENSTTYLLDYEMKQDENYPKKVTVAIDNADAAVAINLLNASCAQWSAGTASLQMGDKLRLGLYQSDDSTVDVQFDGIITDLDPMPDGTLIVTAMDMLARMDNIHRNLVIYTDMYDLRVVIVTDASGYRYLSGISESNISEPFIWVGFAHTDVKKYCGDTNATAVLTNLDTDDDYVEMAFIAEGDGLVGFAEWQYSCSLWTKAAATIPIRIGVHRDIDGSPGAELFGHNWTPVNSNNWPGFAADQKDWTTANIAQVLIKGQRYWVRFTCTDTQDTGGHIVIRTEDVNTTDIIDTYFYVASGAARASRAGCIAFGTNRAGGIDFCNYEEVAVEDYWFDDATNRVYINDNTEIVTTESPSYYTLNRGKLAYYYNTIPKATIAEKLIRQNTGMLHDVDTDNDRLFKTFSTQGKTIGDCMRDLVDVLENSGAWSGFQSVFAHYIDGSDINRCAVKKRKRTTDTATYILSHPDDTANDDEHIIMSVRLKKTNRRKYASVIVVGKGPDENPLVAARHDRALSGSFWEQMSGLAETYTVTDENIRSLDEANKEAYRLLGAIQRDVWEGTITLSGQHEDMFDWTPANETFGSGSIITLNWSPLGISATKFKVKGMVLSPLTTQIYISNTDPLIVNRFTDGFVRSMRSEAFLSPVGFAETVFVELYDVVVLTTDPAWMAFCDSGGTEMWGWRVPCTIFADTDFNLRTYHAEIGVGNYPDNAPIEYIKIYDAQVAGNMVADLDLYRTTASIEIDDRFNKFYKIRVVVDYNVKGS